MYNQCLSTWHLDVASIMVQIKEQEEVKEAKEVVAKEGIQ